MEYGTGDNLLPEDIVKGYVDYLLYEQYPEEDKELEDPDPVSGMVLSKTHIVLSQLQRFARWSSSLFEWRRWLPHMGYKAT